MRVSDPSDALHVAIASHRSAFQRAVGTIEQAKTAAAGQQREAGSRLRADYEHSVAVGRNRAAQQIIEHSLLARDTAIELFSARSGALVAAEFVQLGSLSLAGGATGINERVTAPLVVPLVGRANLVVDGPTTLSAPIVQHIVWSALEGTAPGQLDVVGFDPALSTTLSAFSGLKSLDAGALVSVSRPVELESIVDSLVSDIQRVNETIRGQNDSLLEYRDASGYPEGRFRLVVMMNYPTEIPENLHRQIMAVAKVGPRAGVSFVFVRDAAAEVPDWFRPSELHALGDVLTHSARGAQWLQHPQFEASITAPPVDLAARVDALAAQARATSALAVSFSSVQPVQEGWSSSSRDGITFAIGASGRRSVSVTLGDEREQRHNVLVTGAVGQGKSNLLTVMVHSLASRYSPTELNLYLLDFKEGVTLYPLAPTPNSPDFLPHARVLGLESDRDFGLAVLHHIETEFARRAKIFRPYGDNIAKYRAAVPDAVMPRIVVIVDEFHLLFDPADKTADTAARLLEALARRGRSYGVHIVLASQTISGISALMTRENGIFSQFPIRIALKNSAAESYAALAQGNDAANRLRSRGEAVLNLDYGVVSANELVVIAAADDQELRDRRIGWWKDSRDSVAPPVVFDGSRLMRASDSIAAVQRLRNRAIEQRIAASAVVGFPISVSGDVATVSFAAEPGRNLAVLGAGENSAQNDHDEPAANNAVGVLQAAAISLALQHPRGDAEFVAIDLLDDVTAGRNNQALWYRSMERLGFAPRRVDRAQLAAYLAETAAALGDRSDGGAKVYIVGFSLDRAAGMETADAFAHRPLDDLQSILRDGPLVGLHLLGWWSNAATFRSHIGFGGEGFVEALLMLRLDQSAVQDLLGPFVSWAVRDNRGLLADKTQLAEPVTIIPFAPLVTADAQKLVNAEW